MKYIIFGCLLILTGFAAFNHETSKGDLTEIDLPIENLKFYQEVQFSPNVISQSFDTKPMVKFVGNNQIELDSIVLKSQSTNGG